MQMTRRALALALAAAALPGAAPFAFPRAFAAAPKGMATWSGQARGAAAAIAEAVKKHPFVKGLADGTLPRESFLYYLAQNVHYLEGYAQSLSALGMRLTIDRHRALAKRWAQDTLAERDRVKGVYRQTAGHDWESSPWHAVLPAASAYSAFEAQCAGMRPVAVAAAALMPCFWIYEQAGLAVAALRKTEGNPYAEWIAWYGSPDYSATVEEALAFADELAEASDPRTCEAMTEAFLRACRYEWMFFEAAWRKEAWPV